MLEVLLVLFLSKSIFSLKKNNKNNQPSFLGMSGWLKIYCIPVTSHIWHAFSGQDSLTVVLITHFPCM